MSALNVKANWTECNTRLIPPFETTEEISFHWTSFVRHIWKRMKRKGQISLGIHLYSWTDVSLSRQRLWTLSYRRAAQRWSREEARRIFLSRTFIRTLFERFAWLRCVIGWLADVELNPFFVSIDRVKVQDLRIVSHQVSLRNTLVLSDKITKNTKESESVCRHRSIFLATDMSGTTGGASDFDFIFKIVLVGDSAVGKVNPVVAPDFSISAIRHFL